jgi:hypothetical protein
MFSATLSIDSCVSDGVDWELVERAADAGYTANAATPIAMNSTAGRANLLAFVMSGTFLACLD